MLGREVKTLINQTQEAGYKSIIWNATNDYGKPVSGRCVPISDTSWELCPEQEDGAVEVIPTQRI